MAVNLSPFNTAENAARQSFSAKATQNQFQKGMQANLGQRSMDEYTRGFGDTQGKFNAGFGQRGLSGGGIQSGVMARAMQQRIGDYTRNRGYMQQDQFDQSQQFDNNLSGYQAELARNLANINSQKAATIAGTAQHLTQIKPYYSGGY